jgi:imidazolonepropionase-like amidohydrolase
MTIILRNATIVDGVSNQARPKMSVVIEDNRLAEISGSDGLRRDEAQVLDLSGCTLLPGLIDAHAHLGLVYEFAAEGDQGLVSAAQIAAWTFENAALCLDAGFTTVRDMCGVDGGLVRAIESGAVRGPRVFPSAAAIVQTGGHGNISGPFCEANHFFALPGLVQMIAICDGPEAVRKQARINFRRGATQLKAFVSGGVVSTTDRLEDTQLTVDELRAAVDEARARDTYVSGHAHNVRSIRNGIKAGLTCFEHGTMLDEACASEMAQSQVALDPTLAVTHLMSTEWRNWGLPESVVPRIAGCEKAMGEAVQMAEKAGVLLGSGSDLLGRKQNRRGLELVLKSKLLSPMRAIQCATIGNARIMGRDQNFGSIETGKFADVIAISGDPLSQPELFDDPSRVVLVIKGGRIEKNAITATAPVSHSTR